MMRSPVNSRALAGTIAALTAVLAVATGPVTSTPAFAQQQQQSQPVITEIKQMKLTEPMISGFLKSQRGLIAITDKLEKAGDTIDAKLQEELDGIAKSGGFKSFAEFDDVRANIMMVLAGIDPENSTYTDPMDLIKKDIESLKADTQLTPEDKRQQLDELTEALKEMQPLQYKENIALVQKYFKEIDDVLK